MSYRPAVLATTRFVVENARFVTIDQERVAAVADEILTRSLTPPAYDCARHVCGTERWVANIVLVQDTLNFSFWPDEGQPRWRVADGDTLVNGYWALTAALRRALVEGVPLADASYLAQVSETDLAQILRGEGVIPLLPQRVEALREVGQVLQSKYNGQLVNAIEAANFDALTLTGLIGTDFSSFADVADYGGHEVHLYKRAQICCGDLVGASQGAAWGQLRNLEALTAFADYKVPQVLRGLGILVYTDALAQAIEHKVWLRPGSEGEVEIRAATIWGVEYLRRALAERGVALRAFEIDWHLWELGQTLPADTPPYHLTRTVYY